MRGGEEASSDLVKKLVRAGFRFVEMMATTGIAKGEARALVAAAMRAAALRLDERGADPGDEGQVA